MSILIQLQSLSKRKYIPLIFVGFLILSSFFIGKAFGVEPKKPTKPALKASADTRLMERQAFARSATTTTTTTTTTKPKPVVQKETKAPVSLPIAQEVSQATQNAPTGNLCSLVNNYDWPRDVAYKVCMGESGGNANNQNLNDYHSFANCRGSFGLMQINCGAKIDHFNPEQNMAQAYSMWKKSGWNPWINTCRKVGC